MAQDTAVVILNWNGKRLMEEFLPSVATLSQGADVVVADNGSTDGSVEWLNSNYPTVRVLAFDKNHGFAGGYNLAIEQLSEYKYIVLLNSDVEVTQNWVAPLREFMIANPDVAACQPKLKSYSNKSMFEYAGAAGGYLDKYGYPFCRGRIFDTTEKDCGQYDGTPKDIFWATGAALMVERESYLEVGGLDADFFAHMEEIDLCW
ncbi:MAG: glycosyltransferase family 2 protein, partial [Coprobacter sp.]|nr:glycosyltransferase family 2 protein [Coprobacter sp.]